MPKTAKKSFEIKTEAGSYRITLWFDARDKAYLVKVPSLPGVVTFGKTLVEAKRMAKEVIELHCECELDEGKIVVDDAGRMMGKIPKSRILAVR